MIGPLILIVLGVLLLLNNLYPDVYPFSRVWPVILIVIGLAKVLDSITRNRGGSQASGKELE
jgi:hypothetical protein